MKYYLIIAFLFCAMGVQAQPVGDSLAARDSLRVADSLRVDTTVAAPPPIIDTIRPVLQLPFASDSFRFRKRLFFTFTDPIRYTVSEREWAGKDFIFYSVIALLILFALIKNSFRRYLSDLFSTYFQTTVRQRQIKEQLMQNPLPSLLFNGFFILSGAVFISLILQHYDLVGEFPFWKLVVYSALGLAVVYSGKFLVLKFLGWVFQASDATDTYIFVVFSTNKVLGIFLLPFSVLLAFTYGAVNAAAVTLGLIVVVCLFLYRYFLSYISINRMLHVSVFHFLLYLAGLEIIPLLLINKLLFMILREIS